MKMKYGKKVASLFMAMLIVSMFAVAPAMACPAGVNCMQTFDGGDYGTLSNVNSLEVASVNDNVDMVLNDNDVKELVKKLNKRGYELDYSNADGLSSTIEGTYYEGIGIPLKGQNNSDGALVVITEGKEIVKIQATIIQRDEDQFPTAVEVLIMNNGAVESESATIDDMFGAGAKALLTSSASMVATSPVGKLSQVTTSSVECDACILLYNAACSVGCGVSLYILCGMAGIGTGVGGLICTAAAALVCWAIGVYGCDYGGQAACVVIGYC